MRKQFNGFALSIMLCALSVSADAQQAGKVHRIGLLMSASSTATAPLIGALRQGLGGSAPATSRISISCRSCWRSRMLTQQEKGVMSFEGQSSVVPQVNIEHT
jgi:hypothetical protein